MGTAKYTALSILGFTLAFVVFRSTNYIRHSNKIIETQSGSVRGIIGKSRDGREFYEYLGIKYANPPRGDLRFEPPQPVDKWPGIFDASKYGSPCLQVDQAYRKIHGDEDCLSLNIFVPKVQHDNLMPILFWIHGGMQGKLINYPIPGGMFAFGSSILYRPEYFMDEDVILVTINFRQGSLGFLNTGDEVVRGNMGLKDQTMALRWIQKNIKYFGGDHSRVTLVGESAGASAVHHHVLSPLSSGIFQKAISSSGTALGVYAFHTNHIEQAKRFAKILNCPVQDSKSMVKCLKSVPGQKLMEASYNDIINQFRDSISVFIPTPEYIKDNNTFIAEPPIEILRKGNFNKVPWVTGWNSEEGLLISAGLLRDKKFTDVANDFGNLFPTLIWHRGKANPQSVQMIRDFYFGKGKFDTPEKFQNWTNLFTDVAFGAPAQKSIKLQSEHAKVYGYYYSYKGEFSLADILFSVSFKYPPVLEYLYYLIPKIINERILRRPVIHWGACHFDESAMLFPLNLFFIDQSHRDYKLSKAMVKSWVSFAGSPAEKPLKFMDQIWKPIDPSENRFQYLHIDTNSTLIDKPSFERNLFWENLVL